MTSDTPLTFLKTSPLFQNLPTPHLETFATLATSRTFLKGETLFLAQSKPAGLYLVVSGRVKIFIISPRTGREVILTIEGPGQAVAELPSFDGGTYPANAEALDDTDTLFIDQSALDHILATNPSVALHFLRLFGHRLRMLVLLVESLSFETVTHRLANYILERAAHTLPFTLETNSSIAAQLGTVPELISRNLKRLANAHAITLTQRTITHVDPELLSRLIDDPST